MTVNNLFSRRDNKPDWGKFALDKKCVNLLISSYGFQNTAYKDGLTVTGKWDSRRPWLDKTSLIFICSVYHVLIDAD